jgi:beta-lactamase superfamily II metal-dependent hydrolase
LGGVDFRVLNPQAGEIATDRTLETSQWCSIFNSGRRKHFWWGDSHRRMEEILQREQPQANLLKIGYHGSLTSRTPEFLDAVGPQFAEVSAVYYNSFRTLT